MASKAWNEFLPDILVRIKPKDTLQFNYEFISSLWQQIRTIYNYFLSRTFLRMVVTEGRKLKKIFD